MVLDFVQNRGPLGLGPLGRAVGQRVRQGKDATQTALLERAYDQAFEAMIADPSEENAARLENAALPLGRSDETNRAISDYMDRRPEDVAQVDPVLLAQFNQAATQFSRSPTEANANILQQVARAAGREDEARNLIIDRFGRIPEEEAPPIDLAALNAAYNEAQTNFFKSPTTKNQNTYLQASRPLDLYSDTQKTINDFLDRQIDDVPLEDPAITRYTQDYRAWQDNPEDKILQQNFAHSASLADKADDAEEMLRAYNESTTYEADSAAFEGSMDNFYDSPSLPGGETYRQVVEDALPLGYASEARETMDTYYKGLSEAEKIRIQQEQEATHEAAMIAYRLDRSTANRDAVWDAALPLGLHDETMEYIATLSAEEIEQDVRNMGRILAPLSAGRVDEAQVAIADLIEVFKDDPQQLEVLESIQQELADGDTIGAQDYLYTMLGMTDQGREYSEALYERNKDRRDQVASDTDLVRIGRTLEFDSEEQVQDFIAAADGLPEGIIQPLVQLSYVAVPDAKDEGDERDRLLDREESLRKEYEKDTSAYTIVAQNVANLEAQYDLDNPSGMTDQAFITLFNKVLDPTSVVRESEAARTQAAQALLDRAEAAIKGVTTGESLTRETRGHIVAAAREIGRIAEDFTSSYRSRIQNTINVIDEDGTLGSAERIFRDTVPEAEVAVILERDISALANAAGDNAEEMRAAIRAAGIETVEELNAFASGPEYQEVLQKAREEDPETVTGEDGVKRRVF